jgi:hypothetical protein
MADAPMFTVHVDQGRIDSTLRRPELRFRMIVEAVQAALPNVTAIVVDIGTVRFTDPAAQQRYVYRTPPVCQRALSNLERSVRPRPFSFTLANGSPVRRRQSRRWLVYGQLRTATLDKVRL